MFADLQAILSQFLYRQFVHRLDVFSHSHIFADLLWNEAALKGGRSSKRFICNDSPGPPLFGSSGLDFLDQKKRSVDFLHCIRISFPQGFWLGDSHGRFICFCCSHCWQSHLGLTGHSGKYYTVAANVSPLLSQEIPKKEFSFLRTISEFTKSTTFIFFTSTLLTSW